ncbi:hypothetical protein JNK62_02685 [bacterium]|nr:hypothetical protein [bacterium]
MAGAFKKGVTIYVIGMIIVLALPVIAAADTYALKWTGSQPKLDFTTAGGKFDGTLSGAMVTVHYRVKVQEVDTAGKVVRELSCGDTVPEGTRVRYSFDTHKYTDISWFGSGSSNDSPYGMWSPYGTQPSPAKRCEEDNLYKKGAHKANLYAELTIEQPDKRVTTNMPGCAEGSGDAKTCVAGVGTYNATYTFAATRGNFWGGWRHTNEESSHTNDDQCYAPSRNYRGVDQTAMRNSGSVHIVAVPQKTFGCQIIGVAGPEEPTQPPVRPNLTVAAGACVIGQPFDVSITSNDPDGDKIRYEVDWTNDGAIEETIPTSGYLASGTSRNVTRTFATGGSKTIRARAQDEHGARSPWATISFNCTENGTDTTVDLDGENEPVLTDDSEPTPTLNDFSLRALPSLVRMGQTTKVHWSSQNMTSCTVTGTNGDSWNGLNSPVSGEVSAAIKSLVTYTLTCQAGGQTFTKTATVNVLPSWVEK